MTNDFEDPLSLRALANSAEVSPSALRGWIGKGMAIDSSGMATQRSLLDFCESDVARRLPAAVQCGKRLRTRLEAITSIPPLDHLSDEDLRSVARDVRTSSLANAEALLAAAKQAEAVARGHREQIEAMVVSLRAMDSALIGSTMSATPHS